jgi:hypothetical protein
MLHNCGRMDFGTVLTLYVLTLLAKRSALVIAMDATTKYHNEKKVLVSAA